MEGRESGLERWGHHGNTGILAAFFFLLHPPCVWEVGGTGQALATNASINFELDSRRMWAKEFPDPFLGSNSRLCQEHEAERRLMYLLHHLW